MKRILCSLLLLAFASVAYAADTNNSYHVTFTADHAPLRYAPTGLGGSLSLNWDRQTRTYWFPGTNLGLGTETGFGADIQGDPVGFKFELSRMTALAIVGRRDGNPATKSRDMFGTPIGVHETVYYLGARYNLFKK
jgi:opacity protein-like surface antigen